MLFLPLVRLAHIPISSDLEAVEFKLKEHRHEAFASGVDREEVSDPRNTAGWSLGGGSGGRALSQAAFIYALARLLGVIINWSPLAMAGVAVAVIIGAAVFSAFSLIIACIVKTRERFMGIGQVLTMPLFLPATRSIPSTLCPPGSRPSHASNL
jgi:ABC-2 type transport system permease protein